MKRTHATVLAFALGAVLAIALTHQLACASLPTAEQAKAGLDTAQQVHDAVQVEVNRQIAAAATQPANPQMAKELANAQKALDQSAKALAAAQGLNDLVTSGDATKLIAASAPALATVPYGWLVSLGITAGTAAYKGVRANQLQSALKTYAQAVQSNVPDVHIADVHAAVPSATLAEVHAAGIVKVPDEAPVIVSAPTLAGTYAVGFSGTNTK